MVSVFLSYDRDDVGKAKPIAAALEKAGHAVWWDQHINSGAQYSKVIEQALETAEAVVVLWSAHSVESPWVRDEAAAGRDRGRLVPVTLDLVSPPLGFRQFQSTDLSQWKGRGSSPQLRALISDVEAMAAQQSARPSESTASSSGAPINRSRRRLAPTLAACIALLLAAGLSLWWIRSPNADTPTVSVLAADDSPQSRRLAGSVRVALGDVKNSSRIQMRLLDAESGAKTDLQIKVKSTQDGDRPSADVTLTSPADQTILWSKHFEALASANGSIKEVISASIGGILGCATEEAHGRGLTREVRQLYLKVCDSTNEGAEPDILIPLLRKITIDAPRFAPSWARLLNVEASQIRRLAPWSAAADERGQLQADVQAAQKVFPGLPELKLAEQELATKSSLQETIEVLDKAVSAHPENPNVLTARSQALAQVGAMSAATNDARTAVRLDPFSSNVFAAYINALTFEGKVDEARTELRSALMRWPATPAIQDAATQIELRYGDFVKALPLSGARMDGGIKAYIRARSDPTKANKDAFLKLARTHNLNAAQKRFLIEALPGLDRVDDLYSLLKSWPVDRALIESTTLLFSPWTAALRRDARFMDYARRVKLVDYWQSTGKWPDFCSEPDMPYDCKTEAERAERNSLR